jgi:hypothetical protein
MWRRQVRISVKHIQDVVAADFQIPVGAMWHPTRERQYAWPRQYAMLLARELTPLSTTVLGQLFQRDHSTVCAGIKSARKRISKNRSLALKLEARALLLACEPKKLGDSRFIGFSPVSRDKSHNFPQVIHEPATFVPVAYEAALAA